MNMTLHQEELIHPIFRIPLIIISTGIPGYNVLYLNNFGSMEIIKIISLIILLYILYNILHSSSRVILKKDKIIKGIYISPIGFIRIKNHLNISDIKEISIQQNSNKYFDINAKSFNNTLTIRSIPTKFLAEKVNKEIIKKVKAYTNSTHIYCALKSIK